MIKTAIAGASTDAAGELIRILVNHPEVDLRLLFDPQKAGMKARHVHHGLIGETVPEMSDRLDLHKIDVLFISEHSDPTRTLLEKLDDESELRIVDMTSVNSEEAESRGFVYGLSEIYRKPLVRGAKRSIVPGPIESLTLTALYPLAAHLMLDGNINVSVEGVAALLGPQSVGKAQKEIARHLSQAQQSFDGAVTISASEAPTERGLRIHLELDTIMQLSDIRAMYDEIYDDHNFTFLTHKPAPFAEVEGTDKIVISLQLEGNKLIIDAVADGRMRGSAGEAVHVMNLLFGLHEKTGLNLKAAKYHVSK